MTQDKEKTEVIFLIEKQEPYLESMKNEVFAYFPNEIADGQFNKLCYAHIGQHSACSPEYAKECKEASAEQYADLKTELESIGYNLTIIQRT